MPPFDNYNITTEKGNQLGFEQEEGKALIKAIHVLKSDGEKVVYTNQHLQYGLIMVAPERVLDVVLEQFPEPEDAP